MNLLFFLVPFRRLRLPKCFGDFAVQFVEVGETRLRVTASTQNEPESAPAAAGAAAAGHALKVNRITVIHRQFFAGTYLPAAEEEQMVANAPPHQIGIARVVDELGTASTRAAVHPPPGIHDRDVNVFWRVYLPGLLESEAFAGVFDDAAALRNVLERKHSIPMKQRAPYSKIIIRRLGVDLGRLWARSFHFASSKDQQQAAGVHQQKGLPFLGRQPLVLQLTLAGAKPSRYRLKQITPCGLLAEFHERLH